VHVRACVRACVQPYLYSSAQVPYNWLFDCYGRDTAATTGAASITVLTTVRYEAIIGRIKYLCQLSCARILMHCWLTRVQAAFLVTTSHLLRQEETMPFLLWKHAHIASSITVITPAFWQPSIELRTRHETMFFCWHET